jgi:hemoglobin
MRMPLTRRVPVACLAFGLLPLIGGCGSAASPADLRNQPIREPGEVTLYDRLGGGSAIYAIADNLIDRAMADPRVNFGREGHAHTWAATPDSVARLKLYWTQFLDMLCDGPQTYEGPNIAQTHQGMDISEGEWVALLDDLKKTLDQYHVPPDQEKDLINRVAATHDVVVNH